MTINDIWHAIDALPGTTPAERALKRFKGAMLDLSALGRLRGGMIEIRFGNSIDPIKLDVSARLSILSPDKQEPTN